MKGSVKTPRTLGNIESASRRTLQLTHRDVAPTKMSYRGPVATRFTVAAYVEHIFIPHHIVRKTPAGRLHYQAILKHILNPGTVDRMFSDVAGPGKGRLRALPDWPYLDDVGICEVNAHHVRQLVSRAAERGYSPQTIKHIRNVVGAVISHARKEGVFVGDNPATSVKLPPIIRRANHDITLVEARAILPLLQYPERQIALITLTTGLSLSEICEIRWKHVNLSSTAVYSDGQVIAPRFILVKRQPGAAEADRGSARTRTVEISDALFRWFQQRRREEEPHDPNKLVFSFPGSNARGPMAVQRLRLKSAGRDLGMPWLSWQVLKRAHQALLAELRNQLSDDLVLSVR